MRTQRMKPSHPTRRWPCESTHKSTNPTRFGAYRKQGRGLVSLKHNGRQIWEVLASAEAMEEASRRLQLQYPEAVVRRYRRTPSGGWVSVDQPQGREEGPGDFHAPRRRRPAQGRRRGPTW